jgi:hypothetical protein
MGCYIELPRLFCSWTEDGPLPNLKQWLIRPTLEELAGDAV